MNQRRNRRGFAIVWTAMVLLVMIGMVGLSIDWGKLTWNVHQMQNGADAAALAGAHVVKYNFADPTDPKGARIRARTVGLENMADGLWVALDLNAGNDPNGEIVLGRWVRQTSQFIPTMIAPNAVKAVARRAGQRGDSPRLSLLWGPIFGTNDAEASRPAIGISIASTGAGIICLARDPTIYKPFGWIPEQESGFVRDGGCDVDLRGPAGSGIVGDLQVNSDSESWPKPALLVDGISGKIWAAEINIVGTSNPEPVGDAWDVFQGDPSLPFSVNPNMPRIDDPLLDLNNNPPNIASMTTYTCADVSGGQTVKIQPGWYPNGINPEGGTIIMEPGVYAVGGGPVADNKVTGLVFNGGTLSGNGAMIYVTEDPANNIKFGKVDIGANSNTDLVSRGDAATPKVVDGELGVVIWQDIDNHNEAHISGGANSSLQGTLYFPDAPLHLGGGVNQMGNQVLAGALHIHGNVTLGVAYDGRNMIRAQRSALVK